MAVTLAFTAQYGLTESRAIEPAAVLYVIAAVIFVIGATYIDAAVPVADPSQFQVVVHRQREPDGVGWRRRAGSALVAVGVILVAFATASVASGVLLRFAIVAWVLAMVAVVVGLGLRTSFPWRLPRRGAETYELIGVLAIVGLAFAFRLVDLASIPIDVHGDEAAVGLEARRLLSGETTDAFGLGWASLPELSFVASALSMRIFGDDLFGLRMASVIQGGLAAGLLYGVVKRLFSIQAAALAALVLAVSQMAIHYGRIGNNYVQALFASLLLVYFLLRGLSSRQPVEFLLAGMAAGLTLNVYYPSRLILGVAVLYFLFRALSERGFLRRHWSGVLAFGLGALVFLAPEAVWYARDPGSALNRTSGVFIFRPDNLAHEFDAYHVNTVGAVLVHQLVNSLEAFNLLGESSMQYGQRGQPLLDFWSGALFVLGTVLVTIRMRQSRYFLLAAWFWLTILLGSVLTVDAMFSPRLVTIVAMTATFSALVVETGVRGLSVRFGARGRQYGLALAVAFVGLVTWANYVGYFQIHATTMEPASFFAVLSRYVRTVNDQYQVYLLGDESTSLQYDTARFLIPDVDGVDARHWPVPVPLNRIPATKGVVFLDPSPTDPRFMAIRRAYPPGVFEEHQSNNGAPQFYSYRVEHGDLVAANPGATLDHAPIPALNLTELPPPQ